MVEGVLWGPEFSVLRGFSTEELPCTFAIPYLHLLHFFFFISTFPMVGEIACQVACTFYINIVFGVKCIPGAGIFLDQLQKLPISKT